MPALAAIFSAVLAGLKALPGAVTLANKLTEAVESFIVWYVNNRRDAMKAEHRAAIKKAFEQHDQRDLEKAIGNPNAGEPSNLPGTVIRDSLPGVHH
jgi:hypothetical protein